MESLRLDARRNRSRIVRAARLSFAERGLGIAVHLIADRAGVGMGTLYRHFPSKQSLIDAALAQRLDELQPSIDGALSAADPWDGFAELLLAMVAAQVQDRGFSQMLGPGGTGAISDQLRVRLLRPLERLMLQAQAAGRMRADLIAGDLPAILRMAGAAAQHAGPPQNWRRHVGLLLDGLQA
ncbi:MAG TPA: helix-turn-helix domain-containing protein [Solirubrobacteraceae bacterium]|nr:helix-turn-helix domain-containing protein [Solirubrobacteraceae bacterium]